MVLLGSVADARAEADTVSSDYRLGGVYALAGRHHVYIRDVTRGQAYWIEEGRTVRSLTLLGYDRERESARVRLADGRVVMVGLEARAGVNGEVATIATAPGARAGEANFGPAVAAVPTTQSGAPGARAVRVRAATSARTLRSLPVEDPGMIAERAAAGAGEARAPENAPGSIDSTEVAIDPSVYLTDDRRIPAWALRSLPIDQRRPENVVLEDLGE